MLPKKEEGVSGVTFLTPEKKWTDCFTPNATEPERRTLKIESKSILMNEIVNICWQFCLQFSLFRQTKSKHCFFYTQNTLPFCYCLHPLVGLWMNLDILFGRLVFKSHCKLCVVVIVTAHLSTITIMCLTCISLLLLTSNKYPCSSPPGLIGLIEPLLNYRLEKKLKIYEEDLQLFP